MSDNFQTALMLLAVGMITVFAILFLVVILSKLMIVIINRFYPESIPEKPTVAGSAIPQIHPNKISAIITAIDIVTEGKGVVQKIEKFE